MDKKQPEINLQDIWPQEREYLARPERFKYVRKLIKPDGCVFCKAQESEPSFENLVLHKTANEMIVMNKYPYNTGHLLILPTDHVGDFKNLPGALVSSMGLTVQKCMQVLEEVYQPAGFNVGMNHGAVAGAGIPDHLHWHVIPRWTGDTNFFPLVGETKVLPETLEQTYAKLKDCF